MVFRDRSDAGRRLASELMKYADRPDVIVLGLPRGGVVVASEVARALNAPLDVFLVRKLGVPGHKELAFGAIGTGGVHVLNYPVVRALDISDENIEAVEREEKVELARRERLYRADEPPPHVVGRTVILVDDGIATGSTMVAAVAALRRQRPARIVVAVPVAPASVCNELRPEVDELVCFAVPGNFRAVGRWYGDFSEVTDEDVRDLLSQATLRVGALLAAPRMLHRRRVNND